MLVDGRINSEHIGMNNIMFNYSYLGISVTEYEELKTKMQPLWAQFSREEAEKEGKKERKKKSLL